MYTSKDNTVSLLRQGFEKWKVGVFCASLRSLKMFSRRFCEDFVQQLCLSQVGWFVVYVAMSIMLLVSLLSRQACSFFVNFRQAEM